MGVVDADRAEGLWRILNERYTGSGLDEEEFRARLGEVNKLGGRILVDKLRERTSAMLAHHDEYRRGFEERLRDYWGDALDRLFEVIVCVEEIGSGLLEEEGEAADPVFNVLTLNLGRACLTAFEIHALLRAGFPTAAVARCRLLHEISVVCTLVAEHRSVSDLAERYLLHEVIGNLKDVRSYAKHCATLGYEPLPVDVLPSLEAEAALLVARFGPMFKEEWGWASPLLSGRPTCARLEELAGLDHFQPFVRSGHHSIHAGSRGMSLNILQRGSTSFNVTGATNWGLVDPGCSALDSLLQVVTTTLLSRQADPVDPFDLVMVEALCVLRDEATEAFVAAHKKLEAEESSIWGFCDSPAENSRDDDASCQP